MTKKHAVPNLCVQTGADGNPVPCGAEVAAHYDDSLSRGRTGVRVAIAFIDVPRGRWAGGEFQAYASQAVAWARTLMYIAGAYLFLTNTSAFFMMMMIYSFLKGR